MRGSIMAMAGAAVLAAALVLGCSGSGEKPSPDPKPKPAEKAGKTEADKHQVLMQFENFTRATLVDGGEVTLRSLRGKVILLDLFGTWCPPCRRSVPILVSLYARFHAKGLDIVGLAYEQTKEPQEASTRVKAFREEFKIPYLLAIGPDEVWPEITRKLNAEGAIPTLLFVDRQGVVRYMFQGLEPGEEEVLSQRLEKLLAEPAPPTE